MSWRDHTIVAFDTETTGLRPFAGDRVIEFAAVVFRLDSSGAIQSREDHSFLVNPRVPIPREATEVSGISDEDVAEAPVFEEVAPAIRELLSDAVTVAHNYPFDLAFLAQEFRRMGEVWPGPLAEIDTIDLSLRCFPDAKSHKLSDLCARLGIALEGAHRATNDAAACGECFISLAARHRVDSDLQLMLDWAKAIGRPPSSGPIGVDGAYRPVFLTGPYEGRPVFDHPLHLHWICQARQRTVEGWDWRFSTEVRRWARRWLEARGSGRTSQAVKSFDASDWVLDCCIDSAMGRDIDVVA